MPQAALSKSDLTVLNHIVDEYGKKTFDELYKITHSVPAYYKSWEKREGDRALMRFEDFFEGDPQAINEIRGELLEHATIEEAILSEAGTDTSLEAGAILRHSAS